MSKALQYPLLSNLPSPTPNLRRSCSKFIHQPSTTDFQDQYLNSKAAYLSGLRTPPVDDMSTTYPTTLVSYDSRGQLPYQHSSISHVSRGMVPLDIKKQGQPSAIWQCVNVNRSETTSQATRATHALPTTPTSDRTFPGPGTASEACPRYHNTQEKSTKGFETLVYHSLDIPKCISPSGGNLAEFAAQMTCLFWFESGERLKEVEKVPTDGPRYPSAIKLPALARPDSQFRKWVLSVLSTTQVTQNVILLALLFIYRLKMSTAQIKGKSGSEYRLLIVALMLGNKFLDDNTYTNKTWAEVSSFKVKEIHVMEVEFLSNMRYNLLAPKSEWEAWLQKLSCFNEYYHRALQSPVSPSHISSPASPSIASPIGSMVPAVADFAPITPTLTNNFSPSTNRAPNWSTYDNNHRLSPISMKPLTTLPSSRKRSFEEEVSDHPAKRLVSTSRTSQPVVATQARTRLPAPHLTLVTSQAQTLPPPQVVPQVTTSHNDQAQYLAPTTSAPTMTSTTPTRLSLPPLQPGIRAMTTVYQPPVVTPALPVLSAVSYPSSTVPSHTPVNYNTTIKHHSPGNRAPYATSSPMPHDPYGSGSGVHTPVCHTPISNSPSFYLQHRNSPYKPIRHVNTLLYPPPSASLEQYHMGPPLQPTQMHYQPLGRRNDLRTGVVPEFVRYNRAQHHPVLPHMPPHNHCPA